MICYNRNEIYRFYSLLPRSIKQVREKKYHFDHNNPKKLIFIRKKSKQSAYQAEASNIASMTNSFSQFGVSNDVRQSIFLFHILFGRDLLIYIIR